VWVQIPLSAPKIKSKVKDQKSNLKIKSKK